MLKFINDDDFLLVNEYKYNSDGSVRWIYDEGEGKPTHSGKIFDGMIREVKVADGYEMVPVDTIDGEGQAYEEQPKYKIEPVDVWAKFQAQISQGTITVDEGHLLSEAKRNASETINSVRDTLNDADIEYNGYTFQAGAQSREDIMGAVVTASDTIWLTRDNQEIEMSAEDMRGLGLAIANRKKFLVYKARHFKDALVVLDNEAAINDYLANLDWSA